MRVAISAKSFFHVVLSNDDDDTSSPRYYYENYKSALLLSAVYERICLIKIHKNKELSMTKKKNVKGKKLWIWNETENLVCRARQQKRLRRGQTRF